MTEAEEKAARAAELDKAIKAHDAKKAKADADAGEKLDKVLTGLDAMADNIESLAKRIDACEKADAAKAKAKDDDETEKTRRSKLTPEELAAEDADADGEQLVGGSKPGEARRLAADGRETTEEREAREGALIDAQSRADDVAFVFGERAPPPMQGEAPLAYRRRLLRPLQHHSELFKDIDLRSIKDAKVFDGIEESIYADAKAAGATPQHLPNGQLRQVTRRDPTTGQIATTFHGSETFFHHLNRAPRYVTKFNLPNVGGAQQ